MPEFVEAPDLEEIARKLVARVARVEHITVDEIMFLREIVTQPKKVLARCYKLGDHPIGLFTDKQYVIVIYQARCDYMTQEQIVLLVLHELMHIGRRGGRLIDHDVKDFRTVLGINIDWARDGVVVPDILMEGNKYV